MSLIVEVPPIVWLNGRFVPLDQACISPMDRGFQYGDGVFETLRAENGVPLFLDDHLERLRLSLSMLRIDAGLPIDWQQLLRDLLEHNHLQEGPAAVKITVTRGIAPGPGLPAGPHCTVMAGAQRYAPPGDDIYRRGWRTHVFREGYSPPLAGYKTLNYLYYCMARQKALDAGAQEAILLDPFGRITETSMGSLLARTHGQWWTPASPYQLPGTTLHRLCALMAEAGEPVEPREAAVEDLHGAETIWVLSSLILVMPVCEIDGRAVAFPSAEAASLARSRLMGSERARA